MNSLNDLYVWYETLNIESVNNIDKFYTKNAFFKDPFNELNGVEKIKHVFVDMFAQLENPRFVFIDKIESEDQLFLTWDFIFIVKKKTYTIHGSSHLKFDSNKMINYHRDYWDVGEELLLKLPIVKNIYGAFRKRVGSAK